MRRRTWLAGGVALGAAAAGMGWQQWRQAGERAGEQTGEQTDEQTLAQSTAGLWTLSFARPEGGELVMSALRGRPLVLNFWATWCPPCVREMPAFDAFQREQGAAGWQVVGLAIDRPDAVREHLARSPVSYPIGLAGLDGTELARRLGNPQGGLPFTVVFDAQGRPVAQKLGETSAELLRQWAAGQGQRR